MWGGLQVLWGRQSCLQPPFRRLLWDKLSRSSELP